MLDELLDKQSQVVTRAQALDAGLTEEVVRAYLRSGRWRRVVPGVYVTFGGPVPRAAQLAAIFLHAGDGAVLSHETAAELVRLVDEPSVMVHVSVPATRRPRPVKGVVHHRSSRLAEAAHPSRWPCQTSVEATIVDLTQTSATLEQALGWVARGPAAASAG